MGDEFGHSIDSSVQLRHRLRVFPPGLHLENGLHAGAFRTHDIFDIPVAHIYAFGGRKARLIGGLNEDIPVGLAKPK